MTSKIYNLVKGSIETERAARLISDWFNPLLMPPLALGILAYSIVLPAARVLLLFAIALLFYSILPLITALYISRNGGSDSLDFTLKSSRKVLYGISVISAFAGVMLMFLYFEENSVRLTASIFLVNLIAALLLNFRWKVSVHSAAVTTAGVCLLLFSRAGSEMAYPAASGLLLLCVILPLVSWSRYKLGVHSIPELLGGVLLGLVLTAVTVIFWPFA